MPCRKLGGRARLMRPAVEFAHGHGFSVEFTKGSHLAFHGYGGRVVAAGTPRSSNPATTAIQRMRVLMR